MCISPGILSYLSVLAECALRSVTSVNFFGAVLRTLEVLPFMGRQDSGLIVNIASVVGFHGIPFLGAMRKIASELYDPDDLRRSRPESVSPENDCSPSAFGGASIIRLSR